MFCKKIVILALAVFVMAACTACGNSGDNGGTDPSNGAETETSSREAKASLTLDDVINAEAVSETELFCNHDKSGICKLMEYSGEAKIIALPETYDGDTIEKIDTFAFGTNSKVEGIKMSSGVKEIGEHSFSQNGVLQVVVFGNNVEKVCDNAFLGCRALHTVVLNDGLLKIGEFSFSNCINLLNIEIPESVTEIHKNAFIGHSDSFTITGAAGSYAETFAKNEGITFFAK